MWSRRRPARIETTPRQMSEVVVALKAAFTAGSAAVHSGTEAAGGRR